MKNRVKTIACVFGSVIVYCFTASAFASGNGGGLESPSKATKGSEVTVCSIAPWLCIFSANSGNGGGAEPPEPKDGDD